MVEQQYWTRRFGADAPPGDQYAKLDQSRQGMLAYLNSADQVQRGSPPNALSAMGPNVALVPEPYGPVPQGVGKGGFGGGFGGGAPLGAMQKVSPRWQRMRTLPSHSQSQALRPPHPPPASRIGEKYEGSSPKIGAGKIAKAGMLRSVQSDGAKLGPDARGFVPPLVVKAKKLLEDTANAQSQQRIDLNVLSRQFAERRSQDLADPATLLWNPALSVDATGAAVSVDVPALPARYRVLFFGHTEDGRLGTYDGVLYSK